MTLRGLRGDFGGDPRGQSGVVAHKGDIGGQGRARRQGQDMTEQERRDLFGGDSLFLGGDQGLFDDRADLVMGDFVGFGNGVRDQLAAGRSIDGLALVEAIWARMCEGVREDGSAIEANDPVWAELVAAAARSREDPAVWLDQRRIYGDLRDAAPFAKAFAHWRRMIAKDGLIASIAAYTGAVAEV